MEYRSNIFNLEDDRMSLYRVTRAPGENIQKHVGDVIHVRDWCFFKDGEGERQREVLALIDYEDHVYRTISPVFRSSFDDIVSNFFDKPIVTVVEGESKGGRKFVDCVLMGDAEEGRG